MKQLLALLILCVAWLANAAAPIGTNISRYPNTNLAPASALILLAVTNEEPKTNYNMLVTDLFRQVTNTPVVTNWTLNISSLTFLTNWANAISNYVTAATNSPSVTNWINASQPASANLTNWSLIPTGSMANVVSAAFLTNWANAVSNLVVASDTTTSNGVITQILALSNNMPANLWTNSGGILMPTTNGPVSIVSTGLLGGLVVTQDMRILGHNSASNSVWVCTNATTGEGEWRTASATVSSLGLNQDVTRLMLQTEPHQGSLYYVGTNGTPVTNGARAGLEASMPLRALRFGEVGTGSTVSNRWDSTNTALGSVNFGSNGMVRGLWSSVLGGRGNVIETNSQVSVIGGGSNNTVAAHSSFGVIGGGDQNDILLSSTWATISGGFDNSVLSNAPLAFVGGGQQNVSGSNASVVVGGAGNTARGQNTFIGGGANNTANDDFCIVNGGSLNTARGQFGTIGGGSNNVLFSGSHSSTIAGGQNNQIGSSPSFGSTHATVSGGFNNDMLEDCNFSVMSGGRDNSISTSSTNAVIAGGGFNSIGTASKFSSILGGERNLTAASATYASIIGTSNNVTASRALAIGHRLTNTLADSLLLGSSALGTMKVVAAGATNATVGGLIIGVQTPVASAGAVETNLITVTIPAHTLTNTGDRITFRTTGRFAANANAKDLKVIYGSETILDTTSQIVNSGAWTFEGEIIRTGNTSQSANAEFHGAGVTLFTTANSLDLVQTNGIATVLKVTSTAAGDGDVTNRTMTVWKWTAP